MHRLLFLLIFCCSFQCLQAQVSGSWKEILEKKKGNVEVFWSALDPFIFEDSTNKKLIKGIEADILRRFFMFAENKYGVKINVVWRELPFFADVQPAVMKSKGCVFGASAFSITQERQKVLDFTPPYMPDISVLISNSQVPIYTTQEDFAKHSYQYTAFTARNSTYEKDLKDLQEKYKANFTIKYIEEEQNLIEVVHKTPNAIAYVDLPIYLKYLEKGYQIKRQFIFKKVREGYAIILPKNHDWHEPVKEFFGGHHFQAYRQEVVKNYLGAKNMGILWDLSGGQETSILGAEKIAEDKKRLEEALELEKQKNLFTNTIVVIGITAFLVVVVGIVFWIRYRNNTQTNKLLKLKNEEINQQKAEIEAQRDYIEQKNKELSEAFTQIQKQKEQLEELNFTKDKFFSIIAHDLRSPINSLLGFTNLLSNYADAMTTDEVKKISNDLNKSLHNVLQLIEDLLTWARSQMNKVDFKPDKVAVNQVLQEELDLALILFQKKEIDLEAQLQADLQAFADADHIKFIFRNLLTNALKFTNRNGKVIAKTYENGKKIYVQVIDNGIGIPQAMQEKMFQLGTIKSTKGTDNEKGTGLGLVLCKEFVRKNGGDIWVESKEGKGSCFTFSLKKYEGD